MSESNQLNATAKNGDKWAGEIILEGSRRFFLYQDNEGRLYESEEIPAYRIDFSNCTQIEVNGQSAIIPLSKLQDANISTRE